MMNLNLVYAKTPLGEEAVRQGTRVVQRNLRMVMLQIDGKLSVADLSEKIGNARLVENALEELEKGGYIIGIYERANSPAVDTREQELNPFANSVEPASVFSAFVPHSVMTGRSSSASRLPEFSSFGKPVLPAATRGADKERERADVASSEVQDDAGNRRSLNPGILALLVLLILVAGGGLSLCSP